MVAQACNPSIWEAQAGISLCCAVVAAPYSIIISVSNCDPHSYWTTSLAAIQPLRLI